MEEAEEGDEEAEVALPARPLIVEYARSFFPVFLVVLVLRSFIVEPFRIPSGSMMPTLHIGDFILVNKFAYGIRLPVLDDKVIPVGEQSSVLLSKERSIPSPPKCPMSFLVTARVMPYTESIFSEGDRNPECSFFKGN